MVKQEVLAALDAVRGRYISGQELAAQLGVSRTAVWKAVAALRRDGIPIKVSCCGPRSARGRQWA